MGDSFQQANEILSITQNLNFFENIFQKLNSFEMGGYQHEFFRNFSLMIRREAEYKVEFVHVLKSSKSHSL